MPNRHMAPTSEHLGDVSESPVEALDRESALRRMTASLDRLGLVLAEREPARENAHLMHAVADAADRLHRLGARAAS